MAVYDIRGGTCISFYSLNVFSSEWTMLPRLQAWSVFPLNWTNIEASLQLLNYSCVLLSECFCVLLSEYSCVLLSEYFFCNLHFWMSKVNKLWWVNCVLFYCLPTAAAVALGCFYRWALSLPNFLKFLLKVSSVVYFTLVFFRIRADLTVGFDLAPLSSSAVGAVKSLASAVAAKFGLWQYDFKSCSH